MFRYAIIVSLGIASSFAAAGAGTDLKSILTQSKNSWSPKTEIFFPSDANWLTETTQRWNIYSAPTYLASIKPGTEVDVQKVLDCPLTEFLSHINVKLATANQIPFLATGGGHGYSATYGALHDGLEIDLGYFKTVQVNSEANTLTIGGSVTFAEIFDPLYNAGKEIQTGSCSCVGVVGATLGGGVGRYQGLHGLILDALISVRLVTAESDVITVSATEHSELFWGIRGAGFNFGIILSATYKITDLTHKGEVMSADLIYPASANVSFFKATDSFHNNLPKELSLFPFISYNATLGEPIFILSAVYIGPKSEGLKLIQPFLDIKPLAQNISVLSWNHLVDAASFGIDQQTCQKGSINSIYSVGLRQFNITTFISIFKELSDFYTAHPAARGSGIGIEYFPNQAVLAVPDEATAYPWRNIQIQILLVFTWTDPSLEDTVNAFARKLRRELSATSGYDSLHVYVSYSHGDETLDARYGPTKLPRLIGLKKKWDPKNVFAFNNALPTS